MAVKANDEIKTALDLVIDSLHHYCDEAEVRRNALQAYNDKLKVLRDHIIEGYDPKTGYHQEVYQHGDRKVYLSYRIFQARNDKKECLDLGLSSEKYEVDDFDKKPLEKLHSPKAILIVDLLKLLHEKDESTKREEAARTTYNVARQEAIKTLGIRKPIKYRDTIFVVQIAGYYGERDLLMQDAKIKEI